MKQQCGAIEEKRCKATSRLEQVVIRVPSGGSFDLPHFVVVSLCPKHFKLRDGDRVKAQHIERGVSA